MKRYGEAATRKMLNNGAIIREYLGSYRILSDSMETLGYIVSDLFWKLKKDGSIVWERTNGAFFYYIPVLPISIDEKEIEELLVEEAKALIEESQTEEEEVFMSDGKEYTLSTILCWLESGYSVECGYFTLAQMQALQAAFDGELHKQLIDGKPHIYWD